MKSAPEPVILAVALALLALGVAVLAYTFPAVEDITGVHSTDPSNPNQLQALKPEDVTTALSDLNATPVWTAPANNNRLFISEDILFYPSLYPSGDYLKKITGTERTPGGVLLSWYKKYGLDFTKPGIDLDDPDGDGFSNIVEFKNEKPGQRVKAADCDGTQSTSPLDPQSHPGYLSRLRLQKYESRPFHIQFRGYQTLNGETVFEIYLSDVPSWEQPKLKKTGDMLGFENYLIGEFHQNIVKIKNPNTQEIEDVDQSTLTIEKPEIGLKVPLVFRKEVDSPESTANFVMLMPSEVGKVIKASRGKTFAIPYLTDHQFLVIDIKDEGAVIRDVKTREDFTILKLDPAEWDEVPQPKSP